jgi:hypothetical protein
VGCGRDCRLAAPGSIYQGRPTEDSSALVRNMTLGMDRAELVNLRSVARPQAQYLEVPAAVRLAEPWRGAGAASGARCDAEGDWACRPGLGGAGLRRGRALSPQAGFLAWQKRFAGLDMVGLGVCLMLREDVRPARIDHSCHKMTSGHQQAHPRVRSQAPPTVGRFSE